MQSIYPLSHVLFKFMHHIPNPYKYQIRTLAAEFEAMLLLGVLPGHDVQEGGWPDEIPPHFRSNLLLTVMAFKPLSLWVCDATEEAAQQALDRASLCLRSRWGPHYCAWKLCRIAEDPGWFLEQSCTWEKFHANPEAEEVDLAVLECVGVAHKDHQVNPWKLKVAMQQSGFNPKETVRSSWVRTFNSWTSLLDGTRRGRQLKATNVDDFQAAAPCRMPVCSGDTSLVSFYGFWFHVAHAQHGAWQRPYTAEEHEQHPVCFQGVGPPQRNP